MPEFGQVPIGFLGTNRTKYIPYQPYYTQPVGFFGMYQDMSLDFPQLPTPPVDDTDYAVYPLVKPVYDIPEPSNTGSTNTGVLDDLSDTGTGSQNDENTDTGSTENSTNSGTTNENTNTGSTDSSDTNDSQKSGSGNENNTGTINDESTGTGTFVNSTNSGTTNSGTTNQTSTHGGGISGTCNAPKPVINIQTTIKNNGFLDYIELTWTKQDTSKTKIIELSPENRTIYPTGNSYNEIGPKNGTYQYFIVSYSDCNPGIYSDIIKVDYTHQQTETNPYLTLSKNTISLNIPANITPNATTKYTLSCSTNTKQILKTTMSSDKTYTINNDLLKTPFTCYATFFDTKNTIITSDKYNYFPFIKTTITNQEALGIMYGLDTNTITLNQLYKEIITQEPNIEPTKPTTYGSTALMLINITLGTYAEDKDLATNVFKGLGLFPSTVTPDQTISTQEFLTLKSYLEPRKTTIQQQIIQNINDYFHPNTTTITKKLLEIYYLTDDLATLQTTNPSQAELLKKCFGLETCDDKTAYKQEKAKVDGRVKQIIDVVSPLLGKGDIGGFGVTELTYSDYTKILYQVLGHQEFLEQKYTQEEYEKFAGILSEARLNGQPQESFGYFTRYRNVVSQITDTEIKQQIQYLTKNYLKTINKLYDSSKKEELMTILSDYLDNK